MNDEQKQKLASIKSRLGTGSINIFGLPMSGKDTVGVHLAEEIDARFLSSGIIIRAMEKANGSNLSATGNLIPTNLFYSQVLPYFSMEELKPYPLILSSVGRWSGEENEIMRVAKESGHEIKAVVLLQISEKDVLERWEASLLLHDRGDRADDLDEQVFKKRIVEFNQKTVPVIQHYKDLGLLIEIPADRDRKEVFSNLVDALYSSTLF